VKSLVSIFGVPSRLTADQGRSFVSTVFRDFCSAQKIDLHLIVTGASRANGQVERVMSTLKSMLTAVETGKGSWQDALYEIQLALNCTPNRVTKVSPIELLIGKEARPFGLVPVAENESVVDVNLIRNIDKHNMEQNSKYDKLRFDRNKATIVKHKVGDHVLLKNEERHQTKLDPKFKGPFLVVELLPGDRYKLKALKGNRTYKYSHKFLRKMPEKGITRKHDEADMDEDDVDRAGDGCDDL